ncbi:hypothetical protein GS458_1890 [Geobacillus stearothermophilus]|nr:hypothetical protein GS458_1890 [Geobacillus stearothermophilus]
MRKIYEYISIDEKKEVVEKLKADLKELEQEINQNKDSFSKFVCEILYSTRDKWHLEIEELENEIKANSVNYHFISEQKRHFFAHSFRKPSPLF